MVLPINTFTVHNLAGFLICAALATAFYLIYLVMGRRRLDLLSANFILCSGVMCLASFMTDNLVPAGMSSWGWRDGPTADQLAYGTLFYHRFLWLCGVLSMPTKLHFALAFCERESFLRRHIRWAYILALAAVPFIWTPYWLDQSAFPLAATSSWDVAIPWIPNAGVAFFPFMAAWFWLAGYSVWLLAQNRHRGGTPAGEYTGQTYLVFLGFVAQMLLSTLDIIAVLVQYNGVSLIPVGSLVMGVLLAAALVRSRVESQRALVRLERERAALLESVPQPLVFYDRRYRIQWANPAARAAGRAPRAEQQDEGVAEPPSLPEAERAVISETLETGRSSATELALPDGTSWMIHTSPVRGAAGGVDGAVVLSLDITKIRWAEEALRNAHSAVLTARDEERRRLAMDLHDSIAQTLAALHIDMHLGLGSQGLTQDQRGFLLGLASRAKGLLQEIRQVCYDLYPPTLDSLGLAAAMRKAFDTGSTDRPFQVHCVDQLGGLRFGRNVEIAVFRVAQEAVSNAVRHGRARQIDVELTFEDGQLQLLVTDDGCGFDPNDASRHGLGMSTMKGRIEGIGGTLTILSRPGQTCVEVWVTCEPAYQESLESSS